MGEFFSIHLESDVIDRCPNRRRCSESMLHLCSLNWTSQQCLWCWCLLLCFSSGKWNSSTLFVCKVYECNLLVLAYNLALHPTWHPKSSPEITGYEFIITVLSALYRVTYGQVIYNTLRKYNISILKYFKEICDNYIYDNTEKNNTKEDFIGDGSLRAAASITANKITCFFHPFLMGDCHWWQTSFNVNL